MNGRLSSHKKNWWENKRFALHTINIIICSTQNPAFSQRLAEHFRRILAERWYQSFIGYLFSVASNLMISSLKQKLFCLRIVRWSTGCGVTHRKPYHRKKNCNSTEGKHANAQYSGRVINLSTVRRNFGRLWDKRTKMFLSNPNPWLYLSTFWVKIGMKQYCCHILEPIRSWERRRYRPSNFLGPQFYIHG